MGFVPHTDHLLVTSSAGRGLFDCVSGERVARDHGDACDFEDTFGLTAKAIGHVAGTIVPMAGLYGGGLARTTLDGWQVETVCLDWPAPLTLLVAPGSHLYDSRLGHEPTLWRIDEGAGELRAWGFSSTGRTLLLATSADITFFRRPVVAAEQAAAPDERPANQL